VLGNKVTLLQNGPDTHEAMFAAILTATDHITLETYIFDAGEVVQQFAELLLSRVKINNVPTKLESNHFLGYPERIMELLIKSIKYQFSGFFSGLQSKIPNLKI
jgi:cardiolipin synthase